VTQPNDGEDAAISIDDGIFPASQPFQQKINIQNNSVIVRESTGGGGIDFFISNVFCVTLDNNTVSALSNGPEPSYSFFTNSNGVINIGSFKNNTGTLGVTGDVNFVAPGSCGN
jgi:hypothetical protein